MSTNVWGADGELDEQCSEQGETYLILGVKQVPRTYDDVGRRPRHCRGHEESVEQEAEE